MQIRFSPFLDHFPNYWDTIFSFWGHFGSICILSRFYSVSNSFLGFTASGIRWQDGWNWYSAGIVNQQILQGHCLQKRELGEKTAFWITPLLAPWIKHVRGPAAATADSMLRLELWEVGVASTSGENGVWLTMGRVLLWEQQVKPEQLNGFLPRDGVRGREFEQDVLTPFIFYEKENKNCVHVLSPACVWLFTKWGSFMFEY